MKKEKFALYLSPEKKATIERRYTEDGSANNAGLFLSKSVQSYLDGRQVGSV